MRVPLAESFSAPGVFGGNRSNAEQNTSADAQQYCLLFSILATKRMKKVKVVGEIQQLRAGVIRHDHANRGALTTWYLDLGAFLLQLLGFVCDLDFGIWGFLFGSLHCAPDVEFKHPESATATGRGNNPRPGFDTGWSRNRQNSRDHLPHRLPGRKRSRGGEHSGRDLYE